jgi:prepilin-type N-terminal cleavage/methylation domain-containing protein
MTQPASVAATSAPRRRGGPKRDADGGFTLIEVLLALGLVTLVSAYAVAFHVFTLSTVRIQANRQLAAQLVSQALDQADKTGGVALLAAPPEARTTTINKITFTERWTVTLCRQSPPGGNCTTAASAAGAAELVRVVVAVDWREADKTLTEQSVAVLSGGVQPAFPA